jgi:hypothetical protein
MRSTTLWIGAVLLSMLPRAALGAAQSDAAFSAEDVLGIRTFAGGQPIAVSSTGRRVAYVLTDQSDEWNVQEPRPTGYVYVQTLGGGKAGAARALTTGAVHSAVAKGISIGCRPWMESHIGVSRYYSRDGRALGMIRFNERF